MKFHYKIILLALSFTLVVVAARADVSGDIADPGFWLAMGEELIGVGENGWSKGS